MYSNIKKGACRQLSNLDGHIKQELDTGKHQAEK